MRQRCCLDIFRSGMEAIRSTLLGGSEIRGENATNRRQIARYARITVEYPNSVAAWLQPTFPFAPGASVRFFLICKGAMP
jgi:hypothetical protein